MDPKRTRNNDSNGQVSNGTSELFVDVIHEILVRLPVESILTCRAVCKTWYAVTKDPRFLNEVGLSHNQPSHTILLPLGDDSTNVTATHMVLVNIEEREARRLPLDEMLQDLPVMCSCNGLLCLASVKKLDPAVIYNPVTQETLELPPSDETSPIYRQQIGLGYDFTIKKYKVLRAFSIPHIKPFRNGTLNGRVMRYEILTLGENSWRKLSSPDGIRPVYEFEVNYCNGALYFTIKKGKYFRCVQFDLSEEKFHPIVRPSFVNYNRTFLGFFDVGGSVVMAQRRYNVIELWELMTDESGERYFSRQESYDSHVVLENLCFDFISQMDPGSYLIRVGYSDRNGRRNEHLTRYYPEKTAYSCLNIPGIPNAFKAFSFKPSLAPLPQIQAPLPDNL